MTATFHPRPLALGVREDGKPFTVAPDGALGRYVILGKSGAGKTNGDAVLIEEFVRGAGVPTVVFDRLGNMSGLRSSADGEGEGLSMALFGGSAGDFPLPSDRAEYVADVVGEGVSSILDLTQMPVDQHATFAAAFLWRLMRRVQQVGGLMHVVFEEGDGFAPRIGGKSTPLTTWARACRNSSIGWTFSTHRPQVLHQEIIETASVFVPMKMTGELAQEAVGGEIGSRIGKKRAAGMVELLPEFRRGEALFVADSDWLGEDVSGADWTRFRFRLRDTFEIRPRKVGEVRREMRVIAKADAGKIADALAAVAVAEPKAAAPVVVGAARSGAARSAAPGVSAPVAVSSAEVRALQARIAELESRPPERVEVPALDPADAARLAEAAGAIADLGDRIIRALNAWELAAKAPVTARLEPAAARERVRSAEVPEKRREAAPRVQVAPTTPLAALGDLPPAPSAILGAVAGTKDGQMTKRRICALTGYAPNKSTVRNALSTLRVRGLIEAGDPIVLTAAGRALAGPPAQKRSSRETVAMWQAKITEPSPRAILDVLVEAYPTFLDRDDLAKKAGIRTDSSTFRNALSRLRVHGLVEDRDRTSRASEDLFPTGPIQ